MPSEDEGTRQWIVEPPPPPGELSLYVAFGEGVELTQEQQLALNALLRSLETRDAEVVGHTSSCSYNELSCTGLSCGGVSCSWLDCNKMGAKVANTATEAGSWALMGSFGPAARS